MRDGGGYIERSNLRVPIFRFTLCERGDAARGHDAESRSEGFRGHFTMDFFEAGHMMYIHLPSLEKVKSDLAHFIAAALLK